MSATIASPKPNHRERLYYLLIVAALTTLAFMAGLTVWMLGADPFTPTAIIQAGAAETFPPSDAPYKISVPAQNARPQTLEGIALHQHGIWLVNLNGELRAFAPIVRDSFDCAYDWNDANMRFENPCSGSKYWLDGTVIDWPATYDLDQYAVYIENGIVNIDTQTLILGACRQLPTTNKYGYSYNVWEDKTPPPLCAETASPD